MNEEDIRQQYEKYRAMYQVETEAPIKNTIKQLMELKLQQLKQIEQSKSHPEEIPADTPAPTPTGKTIASTLKAMDGGVTQEDNLEKGSSADNPIDSKSLTYETQAQLPIGTWVTTPKGPHRINQGDINWAKQQMQKQSAAASQPAATSQSADTTPTPEQSLQEDSANWDIRKKNFLGQPAVTSVSDIPQNVNTYGELLQLKDAYEKAYNEAQGMAANDKDADAYAKRKVGMTCIGNGGSVIDGVIRNAQKVMASEQKKAGKAAAKAEKAEQKRKERESPERQAAIKSRQEAAARAAERAAQREGHDR